MMGHIVDDKVDISESSNACLLFVTLLLIEPSANYEYYSLDLCYQILWSGDQTNQNKLVELKTLVDTDAGSNIQSLVTKIVDLE
jgi:hypothetical protein